MTRVRWPLTGQRSPDKQISGMIKDQEAGLPTTELCGKHGLSPATLCKLMAKHGRMDPSGGTRLKQLEERNAKIKHLLTDAMLDNAVLKDLPGVP
jgi:putative transposase